MEAPGGEEEPPPRLVLPLRPALISLSSTQDAQADPQGPPSSSEEDRDYTWTPTRRASALPAARRRTRKGQAGRWPVKSKTAPCPIQTKKKCVNGFIMFCRMNRKQYIRWVGVLVGLPPRACCPVLSNTLAPPSGTIHPPFLSRALLQHLLWPHRFGQGRSIVSRETLLGLKKKRKLAYTT